MEDNPDALLGQSQRQIGITGKNEDADHGETPQFTPMHRIASKA
jgi:hypothetical protein